MTRINVGINPKNLTNEHLLAEHREIKRLPFNYLKAKQSGSINNIPKRFCLGTGHILFFVDKPIYTYTRYFRLYSECITRGFKVENYSQNWIESYGEDFLTNSIKEWEFVDEDKQLLIDRITNNILSGKKDIYHYYDKSITKQEAIDLLIKDFSIDLVRINHFYGKFDETIIKKQAILVCEINQQNKFECNIDIALQNKADEEFENYLKDK